MARLPYAAEVLIDEVKALHPKAEVEASEEDGLGVTRTLTFDKATSKELSEAVEWLEDPRLHTVKSDGGRLVVTFVDRSPMADSRDPFDLAVAVDALSETREPRP